MMNNFMKIKIWKTKIKFLFFIYKNLLRLIPNSDI